MKTTKIFAYVAIAAISVSVLAGCIQTPEVDEPRAISTSSPKPSATVEPVEPLVGDINGDGKVSPYEASLLSPTSYTLPNGTEIPLVEGEPVPEVVIAAVQTSIRQQSGALSVDSTPEYSSAQAGAVVDAVVAEGEKVGVIFIPVINGHNGGSERVSWSVAGSAIGTGVFDENADAVAAAQAWVAPKNAKRPGSYVVLVVQR